MNWDHIKKDWDVIKNDIQRQWPKIDSSDLEGIKGDRQLLLNKLTEKYGDVHISPELQLQDWENQNENLSGNTLSESEEKNSKKYNPDYSESDSNLGREEKNIDQT